VKPLSRRLLLLLLGTAGLLLLGVLPWLFAALREQDRAPRAPAPGLLLVARRGSVDRNFDKTVVLLVEVSAERTWGLVLNSVTDQLSARVAHLASNPWIDKSLGIQMPSVRRGGRGPHAACAAAHGV
jgi:hypothetical protein